MSNMQYPSPGMGRQQAQHLARNNDPDTSSQAAASLDLSLTGKHEMLLAWLDTNGPATDVEMAEFLARTGAFRTAEQARRSVRTLREEHGRLVPAMKDGERIQHVNPSGRWADCWTPGEAAPTDRKPTTPRLPSAAAANVRNFLVQWAKHRDPSVPIFSIGGQDLYYDDLMDVLS